MQKVQDMAPTYGRNPENIQGGMLLFTALAKDYETGKEMAIRNLTRRYRQPFDNLVERYCIMGTADQCMDQLQRFVAAGMRHLVFSFTCPAEQIPEQLEQCAQELLPRLRAL
jgi:alkanesulfonate monooxygenase SsuD/methylene tetrahydromethanopterin reductase-like flavin-dependent oxidoreductase (luciferase family)